MTGIALAWRRHHRLVVARPGKGRRALVAGLAAYRRRDMRRRFTQRRRTVMARRTAVHDSRVIKCGPGKRRGGLVTTLARSAGRHVVRRLAHDPGIGAAMTGRAARRNPLVVHRRPRSEGRRTLMTSLAPQRRRDMCCWLTQRRGPVMTGCAARRDPRVVKRGPDKRRGGLVATFARSTGRHVRRRFGLHPGIGAAMTGRAARRNPLVVHRRPRSEGRRTLMTGLTPQCRRNMRRRLT